MSEKPALNIPLVEEELDWETKCDLMRKAIVQLTRIKNLLDATPLDFKPDDADCSDIKITLDKQVK